jgi:hypothetical protein
MCVIDVFHSVEIDFDTSEKDLDCLINQSSDYTVIYIFNFVKQIFFEQIWQNVDVPAPPVTNTK